MSDFALDISKWVEKAQGRIDLVVRKISLDVFRRVIMKSPVLSGRFKGNWQVAIGNIPAGTLAIDDKSGTATMAKVTAATMRLNAGEVIYLVNNLSYSRVLEYGHSKQAPNGMVRLTLAEFPQAVRKAASELPK
jgi:hypothetical protein